MSPCYTKFDITFIASTKALAIHHGIILDCRRLIITIRSLADLVCFIITSCCIIIRNCIILFV